jgi:sulfide dehydrogenase cytochrome subunit
MPRRRRRQGDDGVSQWTDVPTIAGVPEFVHSDALYLFRDEARPCSESEYRQGDTSKAATTMCAVTADLSDDQIDEIAAYYLPFVAAKQDFDAALAEAGKAVHEAQCDRCHSEGGSNPDDEAGILAGNLMGYLEAQLAAYRAGKREQRKLLRQSAMTGSSHGGVDFGKLFVSIDSMDTEGFLGFIAPDGEFRFGSSPPVQGHDGIRAAVEGFFSSFAALVTYTRHDGSRITLPFCNVFETEDGLISLYRIYIDVAPLYAA